MLWTALGPAASALVYFTVFKFVMRVQVPNYLVCVFGGTLVWSFYANSILQGLESIVGNQVLLSKIPMPLNVFPLSETATLFINLILATPILLLVMIFSGAVISLQIFWIPIIYLIFFVQAYSIALITAVWFVHLRDLRHIFMIVLQVLFYANPIVYTLSMIPHQYEFVPFFIPSAFLFEALQNVLAFDKNVNLERIGIALCWTGFLFGWAAWTFLSQNRKLAEII